MKSILSVHWKDWCWSWNSNTLATWWEELTHWERPWAGKDWGQEEKGTTEDEMVGWHHQLDGHGFGWTPWVGDGQGDLACCGSWSRKELDTTERLNWTELILFVSPYGFEVLSGVTFLLYYYFSLLLCAVIVKYISIYYRPQNSIIQILECYCFLNQLKKDEKKYEVILFL